MQIGDAELPRRPLADKHLHSVCNGTSTQKGYLLPFIIIKIIIIIIIITDLYSAFRSEDTEALDAAQED